VKRDYLSELLEIEKQRQENNENTRTEGRAERDRIEQAKGEHPDLAATYDEKIKQSQSREDALVASNDKTSAGRVAEVEAAQRKEIEAQEKGQEPSEKPPPPNDNRETAYSNSAAQSEDPAFPKKFDNLQDYQSAAKDLSAAAIQSNRQYQGALTQLNREKLEDAPDADRIAELDKKVNKLDKVRQEDQEAFSKLEIANPEWASASAAPTKSESALEKIVPDAEKSLGAVKSTGTVLGIISSLSTHQPTQSAALQAELSTPRAGYEQVVATNPSAEMTSLADIEKGIEKGNNLDDILKKVNSMSKMGEDAQKDAAKRFGNTINDAYNNANERTVDAPSNDTLGGGSSGSSNQASGKASDSERVVARIEMREPAEGQPANATGVEFSMMPAPPPPPPPPPPVANDNTLQQ